jgi:hypothetical protein
VDELAKQVEALRSELAMFKRDQEYTMGVESMRAVWQDHEEENVDATHPLSLSLYIPTDCKLIDRGFLRLKLLAFRSYGTGAASGGASTPTSAAGGGTTTTSADDHWFTDYGKTSGFGVTSLDGAHTHAGAVASDGSHGHTIADASHDHDVTLAAHTHAVTIAAHTHDLVHDIYEGTSATGVTVTINGTDRTVALGGAITGFTADQDSLDIAQYLAVGWNTISLASSQLGRIQATYFVKAYLP